MINRRKVLLGFAAAPLFAKAMDSNPVRHIELIGGFAEESDALLEAQRQQAYLAASVNHETLWRATEEQAHWITYNLPDFRGGIVNVEVKRMRLDVQVKS